MVRRLLIIGVMLAAFVPGAPAAGAPSGEATLDRELRARARAARGSSRVILRFEPGVSDVAAIRRLRGTIGRRLTSVGWHVAVITDSTPLSHSRTTGMS